MANHEVNFKINLIGNFNVVIEQMNTGLMVKIHDIFSQNCSNGQNSWFWLKRGDYIISKEKLWASLLI